MKSPILTIIIPVYNTEKYLKRCIDSVISQELQDIEIICIDDGSTDNSPVILDEYAKKDSRIKVIHKTNGGLVSVRKLGVAEAGGKYIGFVDSDDWIEPDMFESLFSITDEHDVDMVSSGYIMEGGYVSYEYDTIQEGLYVEADKYKWLDKIIFNMNEKNLGLRGSMCCKLFRKDLLKKFVKAIPALLVPFIMVFGITAGVFTPAESGSVAIAAAIVAGLIYRKFSFKIIPRVLMRSTTVISGIFIIIGFGNIIGWSMAVANVPQMIQSAVMSMTESSVIIILMMFAILIVVGCAMEATAAQLIFTPVMMPLALYAGMDEVQFGVWFCIMLTIGLVTPPVGMTLFVTSNITKIPLEKISKPLLPFIIAALAVTLLIAFVPQIVLFLPNLLGA